jgi:hypothetical protein
MLVGLEGDPQASTGYFFVDEFLKDLPKEILGEMKKPQFEIKSGDSAILNTKSVQTYRKTNPNSSDAQAVLYGLNTNNPREIVSQGM